MLPASIGLASGILSGVFGIGGGIITTPALRLLMGAPAIIAVGTPLPVIIPSAATGAVQYLRHRSADLRGGIMLGLSGAPASVAGALIAEKIGGRLVLIGTAVLILYAAGDMLQQLFSRKRTGESAADTDAQTTRVSGRTAVIVGAVAGLYSGLFGLGGGFIIVPMLSRWAKLPIKRAIGTSLVAVTLLAIPGTLAHSYAGNVDWATAGLMVLGVVPGAFVGARITLGMAERFIGVAFAILLIVVAGWLALVELGGGM